MDIYCAIGADWPDVGGRTLTEELNTWLEDLDRRGYDVVKTRKGWVLAPVSSETVHLNPADRPNTRRAICAQDYQVLNRYTVVPKRVTCDGCLYLMANPHLETLGRPIPALTR